MIRGMLGGPRRRVSRFAMEARDDELHAARPFPRAVRDEPRREEITTSPERGRERAANAVLFTCY